MKHRFQFPKLSVLALAVFTAFNPLFGLGSLVFKVYAAAPAEPVTVFEVLAVGESATVLTPTTGNTTTNHNGSEWYYDTSSSMGFALGGDTVQLSSADVENFNAEYRLSWHLENGDTMYGGYRAGAETGLNSSETWYKYVYDADVLPAYYPSGPQINVPETDLTGWSLCYIGQYAEDAVSLAAMWSACDGTYLMYAGAEGAFNRIDVEANSSSILNTPGGSQEATPKIFVGEELDLTLYETDATTVIPWSDFIVFISNCDASSCALPANPVSDPGAWDVGTPFANSYTVPANAEDKYLTFYVADDATFLPVGTNFITITVSPTPANVTISDCEELQEVNNGGLLDNISLGNDIDCSDTINWNGGEGFVPLGDETDRFEGSFDGNNFAITDLYINRGSDYQGLFGVIEDGATVYDLVLENVNITADDYVGGLAGALSGTVTNVHSSGVVTGDEEVGGLVGTHIEPMGSGSSSPLVYTWNGTEYQYIADVGRGIPRNVVGDDYAQIDNDQLVERDGKYSINISQEYNEIVYYDEVALMTFDHQPGYRVLTSTVRNDDNFYTVSETPSNPLASCSDDYGNDCLADLQSSDNLWSYKDDSNLNTWTMDFGDLSAASRIQLLVQGARDFSINGESLRFVQVRNAEGEWVDAYSSGELSSLGGTPLTKVIDLTGKFINGYEVRVGLDRTRMNYFAIDTSEPVPYTQNTVHPTTAELSFRGYTEIDKEFYWKHDYENVSPAPEELFASQTGYFTKYGDVTPLLEETDDQFVVIHHGDHMAIDFEYVAPAEGTQRSFVLYNWVTFKHAEIGEVGRTVDPLPFNGMSSYPYPDTETYPLTPENVEYLRNWNTRFIDGSISESSTIISSSASATVYGYESVGGLVGYNEKDILGSRSTGNVMVNDYDYSSAGGLVGYNDNDGYIFESFATGNVIGDMLGAGRMGGLVGRNEAVIEESYATGNVTGREKLGGLTGGNGGDIINSFSRGNVTGEFDVGGLSGRNGGDLIDSYSTGLVVGTGPNIGGLLGYYSGDIEFSFWDSQTTGASDACGNTDCSSEAFSKNSAEMKTDATFTTDLGGDSWDFATVWGRTDSINDGYPFLLWQAADADADGVDNNIEDAAQNNGDANDDGIPDAAQENVASFVNTVSEEYSVLEVPAACVITSVNSQAESGNTVADSGYDYPAGFLNFVIDCGTPGFVADIVVYNFGVANEDYILKKYNPSNSSYTNVTAVFSTDTIGGQSVVVASYQVTDGGALDLDGTANGIIVDPIGFGFLAFGVPNTGFGGLSKR